MAIYVPVWHSHCTQAKFTVLVLCTAMMLWCHAVMSLQITPVRSYACRGRWSNLRAVCSTLGLYCVTTTWQQIFIGSLQVTIESVLPFPHVTVEKHTFWQVHCSERVTVDSGKQRIFILCKKHELICSNASTSSKNSIASVRLSVFNVPEWIGYLNQNTLMQASFHTV